MITDTRPAAAVQPSTGPRWPCSWEDCTAWAVVVMTFRDQVGHVHECPQHEALLREWSDVTAAVPLPCPFPHGDGRTWTDVPHELT